MTSDILNPRRVPRVPVRCPVEIRHRFSTFTGETEDLGPGGCKVVTARHVEPGRNVKLVIRCGTLLRPISVAGRIVWSHPESPVRLGIAFEGGEDPGWFDALLAADPAAERAARSVPTRLSRPTRVHLGKPPRLVVDFSPVERDILRRVGPGVSLDALARSFGPEMEERTRGALFSLVARRFLVFDPVSSVGVARWREILSDGEQRSAAEDAAARAREAGRPVEAQRLYDEAILHVGGGRLGLAVDRLREALRLAPGDAVIEATVERLARWT